MFELWAGEFQRRIEDFFYVFRVNFVSVQSCNQLLSTQFRHLSFAWIPFLVPLGTFPDTLQWIFKLWGIPEAEQLFFVQRVRFLDFDKSSSISWLFLMLYILVHPGIRAVIVILESFGQRKIFSRAKLMIEGSHVFCHDVEHWNLNIYKYKVSSFVNRQPLGLSSN